jgi:hypothetical protein
MPDVQDLILKFEDMRIVGAYSLRLMIAGRSVRQVPSRDEPIHSLRRRNRKIPLAKRIQVGIGQ